MSAESKEIKLIGDKIFTCIKPNSQSKILGTSLHKQECKIYTLDPFLLATIGEKPPSVEIIIPVLLKPMLNQSHQA